jgi:hypothetical protein
VALPWVRLDTAMPDHPKIVELVDEHGDAGMAAAFVWTCSLAYSGKHGTDGQIRRGLLARLNGKAKHAALLVKVRLWDEADGGWMIHNWAEYQMAVNFDELFPPEARSNGGKSRMSKLTPEERSELGRKAAAARWSGGGDAY